MGLHPVQEGVTKPGPRCRPGVAGTKVLPSDWNSAGVRADSQSGRVQPLGRSGGVASSGHPVDGSVQVVEFPLVPFGLRGSIKSASQVFLSAFLYFLLSLSVGSLLIIVHDPL